MLAYLPQETRVEFDMLAASFGQPLERIVDLPTSNYFDPLSKSDRYGEVCMVIRRPNEKLLTMKKTFYPPEGYRLLTGGIKHGETILAALLRETQEETALQVEIERFLVAVGYRTTTTGDAPAFYTFAFLLNEVGGKLEVQDEDEQVENFKEITPDELPAFAERLAHVQDVYDPKINGNWREWGEFRAVIHRLVWEALQQR
jgi:ADP-ribose pyrophosphatase YjhB (NUDIX family)